MLTNTVSNAAPGWWGYESFLLEGIQPPPVIVSPVYRRRQRAFIVLDGNHRACMCAHHSQPIRAWVVLSDSDADEILDLETKSEIPQFPHRKFLGGFVTLKELVGEAIEAAVNLNETISQVLARNG